MRRDTYPKFLDSKVYKNAVSKWKKEKEKQEKQRKQLEKHAAKAVAGSGRGTSSPTGPRSQTVRHLEAGRFHPFPFRSDARTLAHMLSRVVLRVGLPWRWPLASAGLAVTAECILDQPQRCEPLCARFPKC
jgi:hypothetical protein